MQLLATNILIWQHLRPKVSLALSVLPVGLMFSAFLPVWVIAVWLSEILGIPQGAPVKEQPHGLLWLILFLAAMMLLMIAGVALGWVLNSLIARHVLSWPPSKVHEVFIESRVPVEWYKAGNSGEAASLAVSKQMADWAVVRNKGKWHFVFSRGVLRWGLPMFLAMSCFPVLTHRAQPSLNYFVLQMLIWGITSAVFGSAIWHFSERQYKNQIERSPNQAL